MSPLLHGELNELALARADAETLAYSGNASEGLALLEKGLARAQMYRDGRGPDGTAVVSAWREAHKLFAERHGVQLLGNWVTRDSARFARRIAGPT